MSALNCKPQIPEVEGLKSNEITVGRHVLLNCSGDWPSDFNLKNASLKNVADVHLQNFRLFKIESPNARELILDMTFYKVGPQQINNLILTDGAQDVALSGDGLNVISVITPPEDGKPPQPYPSIFPMPLNIPALYLWGLGLFLICAIALMVLKLKKINELKKLKEKLKDYDSPVDPKSEFYRALRKAEKSDYNIADLEMAFKLYNLRTYQIPFFNLSEKQCLEFFTREHPELGKTKLELIRFLGEFSEITKRSNEISADDKKHLVKKMYRFVENNKGVEG